MAGAGCTARPCGGTAPTPKSAPWARRARPRRQRHAGGPRPERHAGRAYTARSAGPSLRRRPASFGTARTRAERRATSATGATGTGAAGRAAARRPSAACARQSSCRAMGGGGGGLRVYCSHACQAEGVRAANSEYVRRRLDDPGGRPASVVGSAGGGKEEAAARSVTALRSTCKECGGEFSATSRAVLYCSNRCWKKNRARSGH